MTAAVERRSTSPPLNVGILALTNRFVPCKSRLKLKISTI
jgi:hypothetical protein